MTYIYGDKWIGISGTSVDDNDELTPKALSWQKWLSGINNQQIKNAFKLLVLEGHEWPPTLPEFRKLCLSRNFEGIPTVYDVYGILLYSKDKQGSIKDRYKHPLAFSIGNALDKNELRSIGSLKKAMDKITPYYDRFIENGWPDWEPEHLLNPPLLENKKTTNVVIGRKFLSEIKKSL
jgi:hypothetical protein